MSELLVEVRGDGFPALEIERATRALKDALVAQLREVGMPARQSATGCSTQRLMVLLRGIPEGRPGNDEGRRRSVGEALQQALGAVRWRTNVSWGDGHRFGAPVSGLLALLDGRLVPARCFGIEATDTTRGPASLGSRVFRPRDGDEYGRFLVRQGVEVRLAARAARLERATHELAEGLGLSVVPSDLPVRWAASCETPSVIACRLEDTDLDLPAEIVAACLAERQGALPLRAPDGGLAAHFVAIVDRDDEHAERAAVGNERAARDHLEDARFHWRRDARTPLAKRIRLLSEGDDTQETLYARRARRLEVLCTLIARELGSSEHLDASVQAAGLLYADRQTETVREFPRLAGVIGGLLARDEGYPASVWHAVYDSGAAGQLPRSRAGEILYVADRVDRVVEVLAEEEPRVGESRGEAADELARSVVDTVHRAGLELDLALAIAQAVRQRVLDDPSRTLSEALKVVDRAMRGLLRERGAHDAEIDAVLMASGTSSIPSVFRRVSGLQGLRLDGRLTDLAANARRLRDVLLESREVELDPELLEEPAERELHQTWIGYEARIRQSLDEGRFDRWLDAMAVLDQALQRFLGNVLVHDANEALQRNRLALLQELQRAYAGPLRLVELHATSTKTARSGQRAASRPAAASG
ncbi:MAG: glycine--tRNA ligase subunit beta [Acidobacteria bacterium]|nr:MAG: glycine--tRNA ligase subunit beta [Acidobacteriota bacterium]REK01076.1 MAG: glycine--tRNA ligase subunit beta [Acidobacteriota bacterium]